MLITGFIFLNLIQKKPIPSMNLSRDWIKNSNTQKCDNMVIDGAIYSALNEIQPIKKSLGEPHCYPWEEREDSLSFE
ncbi:hypothetical protein HanRHA438_Chr09g0414641 [Helianthus annuus]|nr:hypothetical protein HanRHA438_Chr09g0414641 [Helianthus annuus]